MVFEAFEVTPACKQVLATKNALLRDFPGCAVTISEATLLEPSFLDSFLSFIQQASTEYVTKFSSIAYKAAVPLPEVRDTSDPALVTGLLMTILEANGATTNVSILRKRVRDTVMFDQAYKPWRRSPFYLTVRVAMQRQLYKQFGADLGRLFYKTIMCLMLQQFLEDVLKRIPFESVSFLRQKLGRRLAKLASDRAAIVGNLNPSFVAILSTLQSGFESTILSTGRWLKVARRNYKQKHMRHIPPLSPRAPAGSFNFSLTNSYPVLTRILADQAVSIHGVQRAPDELLAEYEESAASVKPYMHAARVHIEVLQHCSTVIEPSKDTDVLGDRRILQLSKVIRDYIHRIQALPEGYPDQKSQMLLHLMELWVLMDAEAVMCYPLLEDYHPGFDTDILDPIQLLSLKDMARVQRVQEYIGSRLRARRGIHRITIFNDPTDECFAVRYFDEYDESGQLLRLKIESDADRRRTEKETEWEEKSDRYADIIRKRDETTCHYEDVPHQFLPGVYETRHRKPCEWHDLRDAARSIKICIFEHLLSSYEPTTKAAMFELRCPKSFAAYRDATWSILSTLCSSSSTEQLDRVSLLRHFSELQPYVNNSSCSVTLASEKKSFLETHHASWGFPVELDNIIRTCGLKLKYYDGYSQSWTGRCRKASLWHHFPLLLADDSPLRSLQLSYVNWPSSNEIQSSQADCPPDVGAHEFMAMQGILVGTNFRWLDLVRELGSANLSFSNDTTWVLVMRLISQIGPSSATKDVRRDVHTALLDESLCSRLLHQVQQRLVAIHRNWREPIQMDLLITILLKILSLTTSCHIRKKGYELLLQAQKSTDLWRIELRAVVTEDAKVRPFAVWASLLCKRTLHTDPEMLLDPSSLQQYVGASISLNYNLVEEFSSLLYKEKNAIIRDVMFSYEHRVLLRQSILSNTQNLIGAVNRLWQIPEGYQSSVSESTIGTWWILLELKDTRSDHTDCHFVHYNYVYGTLLINGQEMSTIPLTYRRHPLYQEIFGDRNLIVFPSPLQGMSWAVSEPIKGGQRVHLGFRQRDLIVRTQHHDQLHEFITADVFGKTSFDLRTPLRIGCYHWLNVRTGELEIRRQDLWVSKLNNWWISGIAHGQCQVVRRFGHHSETRLLNAHNETVHSINAIFESFVDHSQILVFATREGKISVELKPLELSFYISESGLLQSPRLGAIVTQDQDAGTWYGLRSKIVIQSAANRRQKSILVPYNNDFHVTRDNMHVSVRIGAGSDKYLKYDVNEVLGRIDCPPEPSLLYTKALLHALTSHVIPDPLTARTGVEESLRLLQTGLYQPWSPLGETHISFLQRLAELSPMRGYYPVNSQFMETLTWQSKLTRHIQDDRFRPYVESILSRNSSLVSFSPDVVKQDVITNVLKKSNSHLAARALSRTHVRYHVYDDTTYVGRDKRRTTSARANAFYLTRQLVMQQPSPEDSPNLLSLLHNAPIVGGYDKIFNKVLLADLLAIDVRTAWGALSQRVISQDRYNLMFLLGTMAFSDNANIDLLHKLFSLNLCKGAKELEPPPHAAYFHFRADGAPPCSYLISFMEKARMPFVSGGFKKRSQVVIAENNHGHYVDKACEALACSIQAQWPRMEIDISKLANVDPGTIDVHRALEDITPEWQRLTRNHELATYLEHVQAAVDRSSKARLCTKNAETSINTSQTSYQVSEPLQVFSSRHREGDDLPLSKLLQLSVSGVTCQSQGTLDDIGILATRAVNALSHPNVPYDVLIKQHKSTFPVAQKPSLSLTGTRDPDILRLRTIVEKFRGKSSHVYSRYADEMNISIDALQLHLAIRQNTLQPRTRWIDNDDLRSAKDNVRMIVSQIKQGLTKHDAQARWLQLVDLWPSMTVTDLLTELRSSSGNRFGAGTKESLISLGVAVTKVQQLLRIQDAQKRNKAQEQLEECKNPGHTNWDPKDYPDWLLLEIDGNVMLREEQIQVALATIAPTSNQNPVLQLLMGEGKTSCILRKSSMPV